MNKFFSILALVLAFTTVNLSGSVLAADIDAGEQIFNANCSACHAGGNNAIVAEKTLQKEVLEEKEMATVTIHLKKHLIEAQKIIQEIN